MNNFGQRHCTRNSMKECVYQIRRKSVKLRCTVYKVPQDLLSQKEKYSFKRIGLEPFYILSIQYKPFCFCDPKNSFFNSLFLFSNTVEQVFIRIFICALRFISFNVWKEKCVSAGYGTVCWACWLITISH